MNPQEREVINGIFDRLKQAEGQPRDPEAEALIADRLAEQPSSAYLLAQIVHVQEQALANLNERVNALESEVEQARSAPAAGGFLSSLFGASTPPAAQARPAARPAPGAGPVRPGARPAPGAGAGPWGGQPGQPGAQPGPWGNRGGGAGGGFLASAMTTAAGVAGGLVLGNVLANAFGINGGAEAAPAADQAASANDAGAEQQAAHDAGADDASYQDASYDEGLDGGFDDFGGGDDWV